jgi:hypothetical protein
LKIVKKVKNNCRQALGADNEFVVRVLSDGE